MRQEDHFFLAALRWVSRNEVTSLALVCHRSRPLPMGSKRRPAIEMWGCLHEVPLYRLVDLYLAGVRDIALIQGDCCAHQDTVASWNSRLGDLVHLSEMAGTPARSWAWSISPTRIPVDRRGLLGLSRQSENPWPVHDPEADDEARLIASLRNAGITTVDAPPPGVQLLASGCTGCGVCIAACPHDALALRIDGAET
ncbi:MAG: 4Fe-4S binding protein, partial [Arachnia sp.]